MSIPTTAVVKRDERAMEYIPFGSQDKIKLTIEIIKNTIAIPTKSGKMPQDRDIVKFMMMCQAQRLNPFAGDSYLTGYDSKDGPKFSLITAHQALLKRAEVSADFKGMLSGIILQEEEGKLTEREGDFHLPEEKVVGGWAKVFHAKRDHPFYRRIRMDRFNNGYAQWGVDAAGMICKCAEADALRSAFPTMLGGLYISEEKNLPTDIAGSVARILPDPDSHVEGGRPLPTLQPVKQLSTADTDPTAEFAALTAENNISFNVVQKWGAETGNIPGADAMASLDDVPKDVLKRLLKNKTGLLAQLNRMKAQVEGAA